MPPISLKRVALAIVIIVLLSKLDRVIALVSGIYEVFYDTFEPLRDCSPGGRYVVALAFLALVYISIFKLLHARMKR